MCVCVLVYEQNTMVEQESKGKQNSSSLLYYQKDPEFILVGERITNMYRSFSGENEHISITLLLQTELGPPKFMY